MQIDNITTIIESMTVPQFRTLCLEYLNLLGYTESSLTDGPYDGTKDYKVLTSKDMTSVSIAMSITTNWKKKLTDDISNMKRKNPNLSNVFYFSSQRIPEGSFLKYQKEKAINDNVFVIRYDSQLIASDFIKKNKIDKVLKIANIDIKSEAYEHNRQLLNKNIAISSLLLFSDDANELRKSFFETIIKTQILNSYNPLTREELIQSIIDTYSFNSEQSPYISSHFDRLLQLKKISVKNKLFYIEENEGEKLKGLESQFNIEFNSIKDVVINLLKESKLNFTTSEMDDLFDNIEDFILGLARNSTGYSLNNKIDEKGTYQYIRKLIEQKYNNADGSKLIDNLLEEVSKSTFAKKIASTEMIIDLFNVDSEDLLNIFKAKTYLHIYLDTSVIIPLLCSLLWGEFNTRFSYSANTIYSLFKKHNFKIYIMDKHLEEVASHLIKAAQISKIVDIINEPLLSQNAFITHYSLLRKNKDITFSDYIETFDVKLSRIPSEEENSHKFKETRNILQSSIQEILKTYEIITIDDYILNGYEEEINNLMEIRSRKADILLEHDASTIKYLSSSLNIDNNNVLCTWDAKIGLNWTPMSE
ncbi:hypothetical protein [Aliarcobacter butzleri]|uniref:hypothetical protein n=1 Tax=Aliarcobacter butzleri TaxID=28197 RepID=UPI001EDAA991|nr:hypothetical protein [Aliarcobacter butzleri]MCG3684560.1 hypothetical protein [Aliarcobacter butzleri]